MILQHKCRYANCFTLAVWLHFYWPRQWITEISPSLPPFPLSTGVRALRFGRLSARLMEACCCTACVCPGLLLCCSFITRAQAWHHPALGGSSSAKANVCPLLASLQDFLDFDCLAALMSETASKPDKRKDVGQKLPKTSWFLSQPLTNTF